MTERELSYDILYRIHIGGELSHIVLKQALDECGAKGMSVNKAFVTRLVNGVTEQYLKLLYLIGKQAGRPIEKIKPPVRLLLAMGVYQAYFMSVPESAACNETVKLAVKRGFSGLKGFVNGVLRGMFRNISDIDAFLKEELADRDITERLGIRYSCPEWLVGHYIEEYGEVCTEQILAASLEREPITVYGLASAAEERELAAAFERDGVPVGKIEGVRSAYEILTPCSIPSLEAYRKGFVIVQDVGSMLATELLPDISDGKILDVCATPGGKTIHCADRFFSAGCTVTARDLTAEKTAKIEETLRRTGIGNVVTEIADASVRREADIGKYDIVIADLPCSGLGVIGRKADIKYKTKPEDISVLAEIQRKILEVVAAYVKPGGYLAYSTCTMARQENEENAAYILRHGFEPFSVEERLPAPYRKYLKTGNSVQLLPDGKHDGFYIALFRKPLFS